MSVNIKHLGEQPGENRLPQLCAALIDSLRNHPDRGNEKAVILLMEGNNGGVGLHGYDDEADAVVDIFMHLQAILKTQGKTLTVTSLNHQGQG